VVNLLCILCSRIRTNRELLIIFFHDKHWYRSEPLFSAEEDEDEEAEEEEEEGEGEGEGEDESEQEKAPQDENDASASTRSSSPTPSQATITSAPVSNAKKSEYEFLLFNYLLRFVHREGQIGDFARAGLLFLMDVAMSPGESGPHKKSGSDAQPIGDAALALAEYVLDGDFSEVLGAGLGAVYSLLPSKLEFRPGGVAESAIGAGMVIGGAGPEMDQDQETVERHRVKSHSMGLEDASNPDFKSRLDHFLKLLEFLQDVLRRNTVHESADSSIDASSLVGAAIAESILEAVRQIFLENVLYPSVLECSDNDGSAVAVMSYIEIMIRILEDGPLSDLLVDFLLSEGNDEVRPRQLHPMLTLGDAPPSNGKHAGATDRRSRLSRRKSSAMLLLEMEAPRSRRPSEYFTSMGRFTLRDLLLSNLRSTYQPTAAAALQLFQSLLLRHPQLSVNRLLIVIPDPNATSFPAPIMTSPPASLDPEEEDAEAFVYPGAEHDSPTPHTTDFSSGVPVFFQPETTYTTHEREMDLYLTLVSRIDPLHNDDAFSTGYDHYLRDAVFAIQNQASYRLDGDADSRAELKHRLNANDPIISLILESLRKFFYNSPQFNITLTGLLATLAIHPDRSLAGWLTFASNDVHPIAEPDNGLGICDDGDDRSIDFRIEEKLAAESHPLPASSMDEESRPVVHSIFHGLVAQLERYRQLVDDFDKLFLERRQGLLFSENLTDALTLALDLADELSPAVRTPEPVQRPKTKAKAKAKASASSSIVSFLTPKKSRPPKAAVASTPHEPSTPPRKEGGKGVAASPFGPHYQKTGAIEVEPFVAPVSASGLWTPAKSSKWNEDDEDVFTSSRHWGEKKEPPRWDAEEDEGATTKGKGKTERVTLSQLLDNVVILEESIKELVAIIHARRSLGIDAIRYL
jgi:hypothetical protein